MVVATVHNVGFAAPPMPAVAAGPKVVYVPMHQKLAVGAVAGMRPVHVGIAKEGRPCESHITGSLVVRGCSAATSVGSSTHMELRLGLTD